LATFKAGLEESSANVSFLSIVLFLSDPAVNTPLTLDIGKNRQYFSGCYTRLSALGGQDKWHGEGTLELCPKIQIRCNPACP
jgi:hypothetical protein